MLLEKTFESPSDCKEIKSQPWIFIGKTDTEAETPILWPPDGKSWLTGKDPGAGKDWGQEEKGTTEDEMVGWHHQLAGPEFEQALGVGDGQGSLVCCSPWGCKELDMTERLNWTEQNETMRKREPSLLRPSHSPTSIVRGSSHVQKSPQVPCVLFVGVGGGEEKCLVSLVFSEFQRASSSSSEGWRQESQNSWAVCLVTQSCPTLCDPMDCSPPDFSVHEVSPGKNTWVGCHALLQDIVHLSHQWGLTGLLVPPEGIYINI